MSNMLVKDAIKGRINSMSYSLSLKLYDYISKTNANVNREDILNKVVKRFEERLLIMLEQLLENGKLVDELDKVLDFDNPQFNSIFMQMVEDLKELGIDVQVNADIKNIVSDLLKDTKNMTIEDVMKVMPAQNKDMESRLNQVKEEKVELSAGKLPKEMERDFHRIFNYSGYDIVREGDYFYAANRLTKKQDKIVFYRDFNYCYFESNPENKVFINISLNDSTKEYGPESVSMINGIEICFHKDKRDLMIKNSNNDISYHISINAQNELVIIKLHDSDLVADSYENILEEIERLVPGVISQFMRDFDVKYVDKNRMSVDKSQKEEELNQKEQDIENMDGINREEFETALAAQKEKDVADVQRKLQENSSLILDKEDA